MRPRTSDLVIGATLLLAAVVAAVFGLGLAVERIDRADRATVAAPEPAAVLTPTVSSLGNKETNWRPRPSPETRYSGYTEAEQRVFKENYYCDLATRAREACEMVERSENEYEYCLSLRQYYTYSRQCGYRP